MIETPMGTLQRAAEGEPGCMNGSGVGWAEGMVLHDEGTPDMGWDKAEEWGAEQREDTGDNLLASLLLCTSFYPPCIRSLVAEHLLLELLSIAVCPP